MIDFIKISIPSHAVRRITEHPLLDWTGTVNLTTGEVKRGSERMANWQGLTFTLIADKYLYLAGSIHKHWNITHGREPQNFNDFRLVEVAGTIGNLCRTFNLDPSQCPIENIEFGVNVSPPVPVTDVLRSVINHKWEPFTREGGKKKNFLECNHWQYYIKIYDKGLQFDQGNLLRFEIKVRKMAFVSDPGVNTLADLGNPAVIERLGAILEANFALILFYDPTIPDTGINDRDGLVLAQGRNPQFWTEYKRTNPDNCYKKRDRFRQLVRQYGSMDISAIIQPMIRQKWHDLTATDPETLQEFTGGADSEFTGIDHFRIGASSVNSTDQDQEPGTDHQGGDASDPGQLSPPPRYCLSCGRDISHQRPGSKFCSAKFVGYAEAHRCRNRDSNPRNRIKQMIRREQAEPSLFDTRPFFIPYNLPGVIVNG